MDLQMNEINRSLVHEHDELNISLVRSGTVTGRHDFIKSNTVVALSTLLVLTLAALVGTCGNIIILIAVSTRNTLRKVETVFIVNLAIADLYVTSVADPMSIVAKIEGEVFFEKFPGLCQTIVSFCTISCVTSLMTIAVMSLNRYIYICANDKYERIFKKWNCICICVSLYLVGGVLVLLNTANIGDHGFDRKSMECIWDRMATFPYTVVFSIVLVWMPSIIIGVCYLKIYLFVRAHRRRIRSQSDQSSPFQRNFHLAKTLFIIYAVFITCWAPYAMLIVIDSEDTFPHEVHLYITTFAHLHPSLNWFIYYITNKKFADAYKQLLYNCKHCSFKSNEVDNTAENNSAMALNTASKHTIPEYGRENRERAKAEGSIETHGHRLKTGHYCTSGPNTTLESGC